MLGNKEIAIKKHFNKIFFALSSLIFIIIVIRAALIPFCWDETFTFFNFVQKGEFLPFTAFAGQNNHVLNSFLARICFRCFGDSPFSMRIPNLIGLLILIIAVYRLSVKMSQLSSKIILVAGLLLSFHWLSFFNLCRGYGLSMAFMMLALSYIPDFIEDQKTATVLKIYILLDTAISANLSLLAVTAIVTLLICIYQLSHHKFFKGPNLLLLVSHILIQLFWIKYAMFLHDHDNISSMKGSYWQITFVSLIYGIVGEQNKLINFSVLLIYAAMVISSIYFIFKNIKKTQPMESKFLLFLVVLFNGLIAGLYLQKKIIGIDYPEQRAVLFFYPLFILNAAFLTNVFRSRFNNVLAVLVFGGFSAHFAYYINFRRHCLDMYSVIPKRFYDRLLQEQKQSPERITIGGNGFSQVIYSFMNYRNNGALSLLNYPDSMLMDADYYIGMKSDRKYYLPFYSEIDTDKECFTLLKRRQPLVRTPIFTIRDIQVTIDSTKEFYNFFDKKDTVFPNTNPLTVELNFKVKSTTIPLFCWLVLQIDTAESKTVMYKPLPLNNVKLNWLDYRNGDLILQTGVLPKKIHRFVCYLWNLKHQQVKMTVDSVKVSQLEGPNVTAAAPYIAGLTFR